jgi:hypothetical protein
MSRIWTTRTSLVLLIVLLPLAELRPQKTSPGISSRESERRSFALHLVGAINAAEASYKKNHGVYANWDALVVNGDFKETGTRWAPETYPVAHAMYGRGPEIVPGWKLRLNVSNNGNSYDLLLEDVTDPKCNYAVGSDERGLIRQGKITACET